MVKVSFGDFFANLAAGLNLVKVPRLAYVTTEADLALELLGRHGGPIPFICANHKGAFFQNGIGRQTNSWAGHAGIYVGKKRGEAIRQRFPELLKTRDLPGLITPVKGALPAVPAKPKAYEVIESQATVALTSWPDTIHGDIQAVAFPRKLTDKWTDEQISKILYDAYSLYGAPYDVFEIARHTGFWFLPKLKQINVCSSLVSVALSKGDPEIEPWFKARKLCVHEAPPAALGRYLFASDKYTPVVFRCNLEEARAKI